jgi:hypothetical protein
MKNIGKLGEGQSPTASETSDCALLLNMMIKQWQGKTDFAPGLKTWTRRHGNLFLQGNAYRYALGPDGQGWALNFNSTTTTATVAVNGTTVNVASATGIAIGVNLGLQLDSGNIYWTTVSNVVGTAVTISGVAPSQASIGSFVYTYATSSQGTQPVYIEACVLRDQYNNDTPVTFMTLQDYALLPSKTSPTNISDPTKIYVEFQLTDSQLYIDCGGAQDVTKYLVIDYMETIYDMNNPADNFEYPQEWYLALTWGLSEQICPMFRAIWTPTMQRLLDVSLMNARQKEPDRTTLFFQPGEDGNS